MFIQSNNLEESKQQHEQDQETIFDYFLKEKESEQEFVAPLFGDY